MQKIKPVCGVWDSVISVTGAYYAKSHAGNNTIMEGNNCKRMVLELVVNG